MRVGDLLLYKAESERDRPDFPLTGRKIYQLVSIGAWVDEHIDVVTDEGRNTWNFNPSRFIRLIKYNKT